MKTNGQMILLKKTWLVLIIIVTLTGTIGSTFLAYGSMRSDVNNNTKTLEQHKGDISENTLANVRIETKLDIIIKGLDLGDRGKNK